jgi:hypothetical protein
LFLKGDGKGKFRAAPIRESGIYIPGNGKAMVKARDVTGKCILIASQNRGPLKVFRPRSPTQAIATQPLETTAIITYKNGKSRRQEIYYGASFLSQSSRFLNGADGISSIEFSDSKGNKRKISL